MCIKVLKTILIQLYIHCNTPKAVEYYHITCLSLLSHSFFRFLRIKIFWNNKTFTGIFHFYNTLVLKGTFFNFNHLKRRFSKLFTLLCILVVEFCFQSSVIFNVHCTSSWENILYQKEIFVKNFHFLLLNLRNNNSLICFRQMIGRLKHTFENFKSGNRTKFMESLIIYNYFCI